MQKRYRRGETEANTKGGTEEAKGGEEMQKINREDVVQAALKVERWCKEHIRYDKPCDCPFYTKDNIDLCMIELTGSAADWELDKHLRARGLKCD